MENLDFIKEFYKNKIYLFKLLILALLLAIKEALLQKKSLM